MGRRLAGTGVLALTIALGGSHARAQAGSPGRSGGLRGRNRGRHADRARGGGRPGAPAAHGPARARAPAAQPGARRARRTHADREGGRGPRHDAGGARPGRGGRQGLRDRCGAEVGLCRQQGPPREQERGGRPRADSRRAHPAAPDREAQRLRPRAAGEVRREAAARAVPRAGGAGGGAGARQPQGARHDHRVLGLPVPVLRARAAYGRPRARGVRRPRPLRVPPLPARLPSPGAEGGRGRRVRRRAGPLLADARPALGEHVEARGRPTSRHTPRRSASMPRPSRPASTRAGTKASWSATCRPARPTACRARRRSSSTAGRSSARSRSRRSSR